MKIALVGYGRMGKILEAQALDRGHSIVAVVDPLSKETVSRTGTPVFKSIGEALNAGENKSLEEILSPRVLKLSLADVVLDFTAPGTAPENIKYLVKQRIPLLVGTTGWYDRLPEISKAVESADACLLWSSNFSLGINLFYRIAAYAAALMDGFPEYDVGGYEVHHNRKADSPSGTAQTLVEKVLARMTRKKQPVYDALNRPPHGEELHFATLRLGSVPGIHHLAFDSPADTITIRHSARGRDAFASGAVLAAEWLVRCPGAGQAAGEPRRGVFTMDDVLADILGRS
jgi:4-hydroxy-tetrahydrodipicolinate reductase